MTRIAEHVGEVLGGRYRLVAPIGTGASAHVYLADDVTLRRRVAVKMLHPALAGDESFLRRFRTEAQLAAALNHPNIMHVFDWGETDDGPYLVLEYFDGGSLRDLLDRGGRLTLSQTTLIGIQAAQALDFAQRRELVHRDIKPANLLFNGEGRLGIADFGLARALAEAAWTEPAGTVMGTARYASPEQVRGQSVEAKSDVYSLVLTLIESVTGSVPFGADTTIATLMARLDKDMEVSDELGVLAPILFKAGAPDPADRLDAAALAKGLQDAATELPGPGPLPLAGVSAGDITIVADRDQTMIGVVKPKVADFAVDDLPEPKVKRDRKKLLAPLAIAMLVAILGAAAFGASQLLRPSHAVPQVVNMSLAQARKKADAVKLDVLVSERQYSETAHADQVLKQTPSKGELREGQDILVVVSRGPAPRDVLDVANKTKGEAAAALEAVGFVVAIEPSINEDIPTDIVLDWQPRGMQPKGSTIKLIVSAGPAPRVVPAISGGTFESAAAALAAVQLKAARVEVFNDSVAAGKVIGTDPAAGATLARDASVNVKVSKGPQPINVPNLEGKRVDEATATLKAAGLEVGQIYGPGDKKVFDMQPERGTPVTRGTAINLYTK